jgi:hypothetical protein
VSKKEVKMKEKKERKLRGPSNWNIHVSNVKKENPGKRQAEIFKIAKESYVKKVNL